MCACWSHLEASKRHPFTTPAICSPSPAHTTEHISCVYRAPHTFLVKKALRGRCVQKSLGIVTRPRAGMSVRQMQAPGTPFKEALGCRCQPCTYPSLRVSASLNSAPWASGLSYSSPGSLFFLLWTTEPKWIILKEEKWFPSFRGPRKKKNL